MRRPGLFSLIYWRAAAFAAFGLIALFGLSYYVHGRQVYQAWQDDMQQQTDWIASLWTENTRPRDMIDNWRISHDTVRLLVRDSKGKIVADSQPERPAPPLESSGLGVLATSSPIPGGELVMSRAGQPWFPTHPDLLLLVAVLGVLGALAMVPMVRGLQAGLQRMAVFAGRISSGQLGATIDPPREHELAELALTLNDMSLRLEEAEARRRQRETDIAHELLSPLGRLRALAANAARQPAEAAHHLLQAEQEIVLLERLTGDMLEMAGLDEGEAPLALQTVSVRAWAADLFQRSRPLVEASGIAFSTSLSDFDVDAHIDPQRLVQAVGNLIDNAIAAVHGCRSPRIAVMLEVGLAEWSVIVTDNGRGIAESDLPHLFDRFFRSDRTRAKRVGAGLGLSIARAIAEAHDGRIAIESLLDQGTTVRLAVRRDDQAE